jgi:GxxExxY protein
MMKDREVVTRIVVQAFYDVYNILGHGFLEKVYENALVLELRERGLKVETQAPIKVLYKGVKIGDYFADLLVEDCLLVELKAVEQLTVEHEAQLLNYLKATSVNLGLLLNFGPKPLVKRKIYESARHWNSAVNVREDE